MTTKKIILLALAVIAFAISGILYYNTTKNLPSEEGSEGEMGIEVTGETAAEH
jgi:hypothetical protein